MAHCLHLMQCHPDVVRIGRALAIDLSGLFESGKPEVHMTLLSFHGKDCEDVQKIEMQDRAKHLIRQLSLPIAILHKEMGPHSDEIFGSLAEVYIKMIRAYPQHAPRPSAPNARVYGVEGRTVVKAVPPHIQIR